MSFRIRVDTTANSFSSGNQKNAISIQGVPLNTDVSNATIGDVLVWDGTTWTTGVGGGSSGTGPTGSIGPTGPRGTSLLNGTSDPGPTIGIDGDFYINTDDNTIFGPKNGPIWGSGTSLIGPTGSTGSTGPTDFVKIAGPTGTIQIYDSANTLTGAQDFKFSDGQLLLPSGTISNPSLTFSTDVKSGMYLSTNTIGFSIGGVNSTEINATGVFLNSNLAEPTYGVNNSTGSNTPGKDLIISAGGSSVGDPNLDGGTLKLRSGISSGTGYSSLQFQTYGNNDTTSSTRETLITRKIISGPINLPLVLTDSTVDVLSFDLIPISYFNATCELFIFATDGAFVCSSAVTCRATCVQGLSNFQTTDDQFETVASDSTGGSTLLSNMRIQVVPEGDMSSNSKTLQVHSDITDIPNKYYFFIELNYTSSVPVTILI